MAGTGSKVATEPSPLISKTSVATSASEQAYSKTAPDDLQNALARVAVKLQAAVDNRPAAIPVLDMPLDPMDLGLAPRALAKPVAAPAPAPLAAAKPANMSPVATAHDSSNALEFSVSKLFAVEVDEVQHDPELEEAAIRFANGDDDGAQAGLLEAISPRGTRSQHEETWFTLFDLYRATGQQEPFHHLGVDFADKFQRSAPLWFSIPDMVSKMATAIAAPSVSASLPHKADWRCPAAIGTQTVAALQAALNKASMPWVLDWKNLQSIEAAAVIPLTRLLAGWAVQPVQLRFMGTEHLDEVLKALLPSGKRNVPQELWHLRLETLRISHRPDEFELAALDFCVTYELSPPSWENARCEFKTLDADGMTGMGQTLIGEVVHDSMLSNLGERDSQFGATTAIAAQLAAVELAGQVQGDPVVMLGKLEARLVGADVMVISCAKLIRVDFSAAGTLLNWVSARQSEGRLVQFTEVHRLVAAFFHVIGIDEHAKVLSRVD